MNIITPLGLAAGLLTSAAYIPQVIKAFKTGSARDVSMSMLSALCAGVMLWIIYGIARKDLPVILANSLTLALAATLAIFKIVREKAGVK